MSSWTARAKAHFSEMRQTSTDKTDETPLLSVSSVRPQAIRTNLQMVSSVSSVRSQGICEKQKVVSSAETGGRFGKRLFAVDRAMAVQLMDLAMRRCDQFNDSDQAREQMRQDVLATPAHLCQDLLAYFTQVTTKGAQP